MGLDMYLNKKTYIGNEYRKPEEMVKIVMPENQEGVTFKCHEPIKSERVSEITERIGYWRKANQIHQWFVDHVQGGEDDCGEYPVEWDTLMELLEVCKKVKSSCKLMGGAITNGYTIENGVKIPIVEDGKEIADPELAKQLLPTTPGFFFGSTDYDEYYMADIDNTIEIIEELIKEKGDKPYLSGDIYYQSSW
jgi:hypothetical protein